jgi:YHS domain-containing protein
VRRSAAGTKQGGCTLTLKRGCVGRSHKIFSEGDELCLGFTLRPHLRARSCLGLPPRRKDVQTNCSVNATIKGNTYCFSSEDAKNQFMKNPSGNLEKAESFYKSEHKG